MAHKLGQDLVFCLVQRKPIFLDVRRDRYFMLGERLEAVFLAILAHEDVPRDSFEPLRRMRVLESTADPAGRLTPTKIGTARQRVVAEPPGGTAERIAATFESAWLTLRNRARLRRKGFAHCISRVRDRKRKRDTKSTPGSIAFVRSASLFQSARHSLPISRNCLIDSLALMDFLHNRGAQADLVIGVRTDPYSAHCWVQTANTLLNEEADRVAAFTPILVV